MSATNRMTRLRAMLADEPNDPELRYMLAMEHASQGDDEGAASVFRELIAAIPNYPPAYHQGARTLQRLDRIEEARILLKAGIPIAVAQGNHHAAGEMQGLLEMLD